MFNPIANMYVAAMSEKIAKWSIQNFQAKEVSFRNERPPLIIPFLPFKFIGLM